MWRHAAQIPFWDSLAAQLWSGVNNIQSAAPSGSSFPSLWPNKGASERRTAECPPLAGLGGPAWQFDFSLYPTLVLNALLTLFS